MIAMISQTAFFRGMSPVPLSLLWVGHSRLPARSVPCLCATGTRHPLFSLDEKRGEKNQVG